MMNHNCNRTQARKDLKFSAEALTAVRLEDALIDPEVPRKGVRLLYGWS